jgi:pimeloyl-ACP methyl ester carboxylesterase
MTQFQKSDLVVDGVRVQVLEAGKGKPLVYFHGAGAGRGFDELLPLAEDRRLIVPIHPGFGGSDDDLKINSILDYVVHYAALFDQLKLDEPVDLIGHSLGGWIAGLFAVFNSHRLRRMVLACPAGIITFSTEAETLLTNWMGFQPSSPTRRIAWAANFGVEMLMNMSGLAALIWNICESTVASVTS